MCYKMADFAEYYAMAIAEKQTMQGLLLVCGRVYVSAYKNIFYAKRKLSFLFMHNTEHRLIGFGMLVAYGLYYSYRTYFQNYIADYRL